MEKVKKEFLNKFLEAFDFKCYLEEKQKGFCTICSEPAKTLKVSIEIKREEFTRTQFVEYCNYCFTNSVFSKEEKQVRKESSPMYA